MIAGSHSVDALTADQLAELSAIVDPSRIDLAPAVRDAYGRDATALYRRRPAAVIHPESAEEIAAVLAWATQHGVPVTPRGGGSNLSAATLTTSGGIVLALAGLRSIIEVNPEEMLAVVEPGVTTAELDKAAGVHGLRYTPDPGSRVVATIGGNVAMCSGGLRGLKYGTTRNYVLGLEAVLPTGEIIHTGGRLWKDVAGYDLTRLLTGSEGTLAVLTKITVALNPIPEASANGIAYFDTLEQAATAVAQILAAGVVPCTLEFLDRRCIEVVEEANHLGLDTSAGALLIFGDDGDAEPTHRAVRRMGEICTQVGARAVTTAKDIVESEALLAARRCALPALARLAPVTMLEDVSVPRTRLAEMVARINAIAAEYNVVCATFGHAGDGNLHPTMCFDPNDPADPGVAERAHAAFAKIFAAAIDLGGTITGEHGVGVAKLPYLEQQLGGDQMALLVRLKAAFDPAGILNPGKIGSARQPGARSTASAVADAGSPAGAPHFGHPMPTVNAGGDSQSAAGPVPAPAPNSAAGAEAQTTRGIFDADKLAACISCGYCLSVCPTYQLTHDEQSSPRGRITLMRALETRQLEANDATLTEESSFCLGCRACETVCPAGVEYGVLLEQWRDHQWKGRRGPLVAKGLTTLFRYTPVVRMEGLVRGYYRTFGEPTDAAPHYLHGCAERGLYPGLSKAVHAIAPEVDAPVDQGCCGALHAHNGQREIGLEMARELGEKMPGDIVTTSGGCAAHLAEAIGRDRVHEISEYLVATDRVPNGEFQVDGRRARVSLQDSCHLRNGCHVTEEPRQILRAVADYVELPSAGTCCGAAGSYSMVRPKDSKRFSDPKVEQLEALRIDGEKLDYVVLVNPGCLMQMRSALRRAKSSIRAIHIAEVIARTVQAS